MPTTRSSGSVKTPSPSPSPKKRSRSPAKKSPRKSRSRSQSRSRSAGRQPAARSRSRSAGRYAANKTPAKELKTPEKPKRSPSRKTTVTKTTVTTSSQENVATTPTRVSRRLQEKIMITKTGDAPAEIVKSKSVASSAAQTVGMAGGLLVVAMIGFVYYVALLCSKKSCTILAVPPCPAKWESFINANAMLITIGFYACNALVSALPICSLVEGQPMKDGRRLAYRLNGWVSLLVASTVFGYAMYRGCPLDYFEKHYLQFVTSAIILSLLESTLIFLWSLNAPLRDRAPGADGTFLNDFWIGRELNPRFGSFDVKIAFFRAGMIAWLLVDWLYLGLQFRNDGAVRPALGLVVFCHTIYIFLTIQNESFWLYSPDFSSSGTGYMFFCASMTFFPTVFSLQARFLYLYPLQGVVNPYAIGALFVMNAVGLVVFRGSNWQKSEFRKNPYNPELSHLSSIPTATGKRLLCSGWWGLVRHPNYAGDIMMALAWSLPCGFNYALPYLYPVYLIALLVPRCITDEQSCRERYGDAWDKYTSTVKYRLIPYIF